MIFNWFMVFRGEEGVFRQWYLMLIVSIWVILKMLLEKIGLCYFLAYYYLIICTLKEEIPEATGEVVDDETAYRNVFNQFLFSYIIIIKKKF